MSSEMQGLKVGEHASLSFGHSSVSLYSQSKNCGNEWAAALIHFCSVQYLWISVLSLATPSHTCFITLNKLQKHISMEHISAEHTKNDEFIYLSWHKMLMQNIGHFTPLTEWNKVISPSLTKCLRMLWFLCKCEIEWTGKFTMLTAC